MTQWPRAFVQFAPAARGSTASTDGLRTYVGECRPQSVSVIRHWRRTACWSLYSRRNEPCVWAQATRGVCFNRLAHDRIKLNRDHGLLSCLSMIFFRKPVPTFRDHALASAASLPACLFPLAVLRVVISPDRLDVFRVNPGPGPEFRARNDRLLPLRSIDEIASDRRSWRGC